MEFFNNKPVVKLSIKLRLGLSDETEVNSVMEVIKGFPISEIILHPRLGVQKYKGVPNWELFGGLAKKHALVGNGDICSMIDLEQLTSKYPEVKAWMIGRGLLKDPCLLSPGLDRKETMLKLHDLYLKNLGGLGLSDQQKLNHLKCFWEYPSQNLINGKRIYRKMRSCGKISEYNILKHKLFELEIMS